MVKIICISDTHGLHDKVEIPECDILIHAGDWSRTGTFKQTSDFADWLMKQPATYKIIIPGNHEIGFQKSYPESRNWFTKCINTYLLIDEGIEIRGIKFYGSPWTPAFGHGWAYNAGRDPIEAAHIFKPFIGDIWAKIPDDTDFLITHGMPLGSLDLARRQHVGDNELKKRIVKLKNLKHVVGGHLHFCGGQTEYFESMEIHNASICDENYRPIHKPIIIEY